MKLHLPVLLRRLLMAAVSSVTVAEAAVMHQDVSVITYTDFGQNHGRYSVGNVNSLLRHIREQNGGVQIYYPNDLHPTYTLAHDMIDYSSTIDGGFGALVGRNFFATVAHNGVWTGTVTGKAIGRDNSITYVGVEYRHSSQFVLTPSVDYKITRLSKITTDVTPSVVYGETNRDWSALYNGGLAGQLLYRAGGGYSGIAAYDGSQTVICYTYTYITGGIMVANGVDINNPADGAFRASYTFIPASSGITPARPLPYRTQGGDSGSPVWIWNTSTNQYEYLAAHQARGGNNSYARGASEWTVEKMESYDKTVDMSATADSTAYIYAAKTLTGTTLLDNQGRVANPYYGVVTDSSGKELARYIGTKQGINTWNDLSDRKNLDNWYNYGAGYFNSTGSNSSTDTSYAHSDMMQTENLHFIASAANNNIVVQENADLGIGYVRLSKADSLEQADFTITGADTYTQLNSAGYVIDDKVNLHLKLTGETNYMREWRAVVAEQGKLYIEGTGDTNVLLNLGGQGTVYLKREGGASAYNVLANNGVAVVINDINQIERDFTFGFRGGVLDMNGCSMTWNNGNTDVASDGFTIRALDEQALITNMKAGSTTELTWTQGGTQKWLGSFIDSQEGGALHFTYDGGEGGVLTMNTIHTSLANEGSGMAVASGKLILSGSNTVHAPGSFDGRSANRYSSADDWHYADAATDVEVRSGATFELGSHARLTGNVSVAAGATFNVREGVKHQYEYIEGGERLENTYDIAPFYGLFGAITNNGQLNFHYSDGTTATNLYTGNMSGSGSMEIDLGTSGAILVLSGTNTMSGARNIISGGVVLEGAGAFGTAGTTQAWQIGEKAWLAVSGAETPLLPLIAGTSSGSLALANDIATRLDMSEHQNLFLGAMKGMSVHYGTAGTTEELAAWHPAGTEGNRGQWLFGGGEGEIVVNWLLHGDNDLVLGNDYMSGTVTLTNTGNDFTGKVIFSAKGNVVLNFTDARALGAAKVALSYGKAMSGGDDIGTWLAGSVVNTDATGILLLDNDPDANISLTRHESLHLGANGSNVKFTGNIAVRENGTYYFGGPGSLFLENALAANGTNNLVVDAEGFSGGLVQLNKAAAITGDVTVTGYDTALAEGTGINSGSITLWLNADNALATVKSVAVTQGGSLGIRQNTTQRITSLTISGTGAMDMAHSTTLQVANLQMLKGSRLSGPSGEVTIEVGQGTLAGAISGKTLVKVNSSGTLTIADGNSLAFDRVEVKEGTLNLAWNMQGGSSVLLYGGGNITFNRNAISGSLGVVENATITMDSKISNLTRDYHGGIGGALDIAQGATLRITGTGFSFRGSTTHLSSGGTLDMSQLGMAQLAAGAGENGQVFASTVMLGDTTLRNISGTEDMALEFKHLALTGAATLEHSSWNTNWAIHSLTGEGSLTFNMNTSHTKTSTLTLDGEGNMSGSIVAKTANNNTDGNRRFQNVLQLRHELAAQNAELSLQGADNTRYVALALNADRIRMKGLSSTGYSGVYAGAAFAEAQANAPASTRNTTLELTGDGTYTYSGGVAGSAQSAISLLKTGSGTQIFENGKGTLGADQLAVFGDVSVLGGTLALNNTNTTVHGNYAIGQGATLTLNSGNGTLDLVSGRTLSILAAGDALSAAASATLSGHLKLSGGTLSFSGKGMSTLAPDSYLLDLTGTLTSSGITHQNILFTDGSYIQDGTTYYLAKGNFAGLGLGASSFTASGVDHFDAKFALTSQGLSVVFSSKDGSLIWQGTDANHAWTGASFAGQDINNAKSFIFTDAAANKKVLIGENITFGQATFNSSEHYTVSSNGGNLSLDTLQKDGSGDLILQSGVTVTGNTVANDGRIVLSYNALQGKISGAGTITLATPDVSVAGLSGTIGTLELLDGVTTTVDTSLKEKLTISKTLVQTGAALQVNCAFASDVTLNGGSLSMANGSSLTGLIVGKESTLTVASGNSASLTKASSLNGATLHITGGGTTSITAATKIAKINLEQGTLAVSSHSNVQGIGEINLGSGTSLLFQIYTGMSGAAINMLDGSSITLENGNSSSYHILDAAITLTGTATIYGSRSGNGTLVSGSIRGNGTLVLARGDGNSLSYTAVISDQSEQAKLALKIDQGASVTLSGTGSYSGGTTINGAKVTVNNVYALGTGLLTMTSSTLELGKDLAIAAMSGGTGSTINSPWEGVTDTNPDHRRNILLMGTQAGSSYTFSGALRGVSLTKAGDGSQAFTNVGDILHVAVQGGELSLSGSALDIGGAVSVEHGATLTLGGNITLAQAINSKGTVNFAENAVISLSETDFDEEHRYVVVTGSGTIGTLSLSNFIIDGTGASDMAEQGLNIEVINKGDGTASLYAFLSDLTWNGTDGAVWNTDTENKVWLNKRSAEDYFAQVASVRFRNGDGVSTNVSVGKSDSDVMTALKMDIEGTGFSFSGSGLTVLQGLTIAENATATFGFSVDAGTITVGGEAEFQAGVTTDSLSISGNATFGGELPTETDHLSVKQGLTVAENATATFGNSVETGTITLDGKAIFQAAVTTTSLGVSGNATVGGDLSAETITVGGEATFQAGVTATSLSISGNATVGGALRADTVSLTGNAVAAFNGSYGKKDASALAVVLGGTSRLKLASDGSINIGATSTGTLEVLEGASVNLGTIGGEIKYYLAGDGNIAFTSSSSNAVFATTDNAFKGTLTINLGTSHVVANSPNWFTADSRPNLVLTGGNNNAGFILNKSISGETSVLHIGSLASNSATAYIRGDYDTNQNGNYRYLSVHQDTETTFAGSFQKDEGNESRSTGLMMNSTNGKGRLKLTGNNTSPAKLIINSGTVEISGNGVWSGNVEVNNGGQLDVRKSDAVAAGKTITLSGKGGNNSGALSLANGLTVGNTVSLTADGAGIYTAADTAATLKGTVSGGTLTKLGAGSLTLSGTTDLTNLAVESGMLTLNGYNITLGNFGSNNGTPPLGNTISENGTLVLSGFATINNSISNSGTLTLSGSTTINSTITNSGTLSLNGYTVLNNTITNNGELKFSSDVWINIQTEDFDGTKYVIVDGTGSTSDNLTRDRILINNVYASELHLILQGVGTSTVCLTYDQSQVHSLTWNGKASSKTWDSATSNLNWLTGNDSASATHFTSMDNVSFTSDAESKDVVITQDGVKTMNMTVSEKGYAFSGGKLTVIEDLTLEAGATASFTNTLDVKGNLVLNEDTELTLSGTGLSAIKNLTLKAGATASFAQFLSLKGDLTMAEDTKLTLSGGTEFAIQTLALESGRTLEIGTDITPVIALRGGTLAVQNGVTFDGVNVEADSTLDVASGSATFTADFNVTNNALLTKTGAGTLVLSSQTTPGNFRVAGGALSLSGTAYKNISGIDLQTGTKLILNNQRTSINKTGDFISMAGGSTLEMHNGGTNTLVNADIAVDALESAAVIRGIENGNNLQFTGTISGLGTLQYRSLVDGTRSANSWQMNSTVTDGVTGTLRVEMNHANLRIGGDGANTYSGGTSIADSTITVAKETAFGTGALSLSNSTLTLASNLSIASLSGEAGNTINANAKTLTLTGAEGEAVFDANGSNLNNISLVKSGTGTQVFKNMQTLNRVQVSGGELSLSGTSVASQGGETAAQTSSLTLNSVQVSGGTLSLSAGSVASQGGETAAQTSSLTLGSVEVSGGELSLIGSSVASQGGETATQTSSLTLGSVEMNGGTLSLGTGSQGFEKVQALGSVAVNNGTLSLTGTSVDLQGDVTVAQSATLTLGGAISLASPIRSDGTVNFLGNATFELSRKEDFGYSRDYSIVTGSGSITGITLTNFIIDGKVATENSYELVNTGTGNLYLSLIEVHQLVWSGTETSNAWVGTNWKISSGSELVDFTDQDNVSFTAEAVQKTVDIDPKGVIANRVSVEAEGYSFSGGQLTMLGDMSLTDGAGAVFDNAVVLGGDTPAAPAKEGVEIATAGSSSVTFNGALSGGPLTKTGTGSMTLKSAGLASLASATLSEGATIISDRLGSEADFARVLLGTDATLTLNLSTETAGTKLLLDHAGSGIIDVRSGMLRVGAGASSLGSATLQMSDGTGLSFAATGEGDSTLGNHLLLADGSTVMVYAEGTNNVISGNISGGGMLSKSGSGTVTLAGSLENFTGVLTVAANNSADNRLILATDATLSRLNFGDGSSLMVGAGHTLTLSGMTTENFYASVSHILAADTNREVVNVTLSDSGAETSLDTAQSVRASYRLTSGLTLKSSTGAGSLTIERNGIFAVNGNVQIGTGAGLQVAGGTLSAENIILDRPSAESGLVPSFTLSSGTLNLTGTGGSISLAGEGTAYNLSLTGGTINTPAVSTLAANLTLGGVTFTGGGMSFAAGNTVTWNGQALSNNGGTLTFNGQIELGAESFDHATKTSTYYDSLDAASGNGYAALLFAQNTNGGTVNFGAGSTISYKGIDYKSNESEGNVWLQGNAGIYYVTSGSLDYGAAGNSAASAGTTGISLAADTTITIQKNATLDLANISKNNHALTIDGNGVFINGTTGANMNATLAPTWAGTVVLSGSSDAIQLDQCGKYANGSTVRCVGLSGWINPNATDTNVNVEFAKSEGVDYAFYVTASSQRTYLFNGKVTGEGNVKIKSGGSGDHFVFTNDVAGWNGGLDVVTQASTETRIWFKRNGDSVINLSGIKNIGEGTLKVEVSGTGNKWMTGKITGATLTMSGSGTLEMDQAPTLKGLTVSSGALSSAQGITLQGNATVAANAALTLGGSLSLSSAIVNSGTVTFLDDSLISVQSSAFRDNRYDVVTGNGSITSALTLTNFTIDGVAADDDGHYSLVSTGTNLYLSYSDKATLLWNGSQTGNTWSGANWTAKVGGSAKSFTEGDHVRFTDNVGNKAVVVDAQGVTATNVSIESAGYSFSGGGITVQGDLSLADNASAAFSNPLSLGADSTLALGSGSTLSLGVGEMTLGNTVTIGEGGTTLNLAENTSLTLNGNVSGGALNKQGAGSLTLHGGADGSISLGSLTVESGTLNLGGTVSLGGTIVNSGTLNIADTTKFQISQADFSADNTFTLVQNTGTLSGSIGLEDITIDGTAASTLAEGRLSLKTDASRVYLTYGDSLTLYWNGTTDSNNWRSRNWLNGADAPATFYNGDNVHFTEAAAEKGVHVNDEGVRANTVSIESAGYTFSGGELEVTGTMSLGAGVSAKFANDVVFRKNTAEGEKGITLAMADDAAITFSGTVSGGDVTKTGAGTVTAGVDALTGLDSFTMASGNLVLTGTAGAEANLGNLRLGSGTSLSVELSGTPTGSLLTLHDTSAADVKILSGTLRVEGTEQHLGSGTLQMSGGTALSFAGNSTLSKKVDVVNSGALTLYGTGTENVIESGISGAGALTVANGANITVKGDISVGSVNLNSGGTLHLDLGKAVDLPVANAGSGTLSVAKGTSVNLGTIAVGDVNYHFAGDGNIEFKSSSSNVVLASSGSTFNGTLTINLGTSHVIVNSHNLFTVDSRPNLVLTGGDSNSAGFILNKSISGETSVLHIGSLASNSATAYIRGDYDKNQKENYRYISVHQDTDTVFAGSFRRASDKRSPGLIKNGTGRLRLTGDNTSDAKLIINSGTVEISGDSGAWGGDVTVNNGGLLDVQKSGAVAEGKTITLTGMGANNSSALNLANGVTVANDVTIAAGGAGIYTAEGTAATLSGTVSGSALTKLGGGKLTLSGTTTLNGVHVNEGELSLSGASIHMQGEVTVAQPATLTLGGAIDLASPILSDGTVNFLENTTFALTSADFGDSGIYSVVTGNGSIISALTLTNFTIDGVAADSSRYKLSGMGTGNLYLSLIEAHQLTWNGSAEGDGEWGGQNWSTSEGGTGNQEFSERNSVLFTDNAGVNKTVTVAQAGVVASDITIEGDGYSFSGGAVTAEADLTLANNVEVSFNSGLTVTGEVTMGENAVLRVSGGLNAENSPIRVTERRTLAIDDGQLGEGTRIILDGGTLELASSGDMSAVEIASNSHVKVAGIATVSLAEEGKGGLTKTGAGELALNFGALNKNYTVQEGTLSLAQPTTTIGDNTGLTVESAGTLNGTEIQMTSGTLNVTGGTVDVQSVSFRSAEDSSNPTDSRGTLNLSGDSVLTVGAGGIKGVQQGVVMNLGDGTVKAKGSDFTIGSEGTTDNRADVTLSGTKGTTFDTNGHTITVENDLVGNGALNKTGEGTLTLQGANTYAGDTTVSQGTLALDGQGSLDNGHVHLSAAENAVGELKSAVVSGNSISSATPDKKGEMKSMKVQLLELQLTVKDMVIAADTTISKLPEVSRMVPMAVAYSNARSATKVAVENSVLELVAGTNATVSTTAKLTETLTVNDTYSIAEGTLFTTVTCNNIAADTLTGSLVLDFAEIWSGDIVNSGAIAVVFQGISAFGAGTAISASIPGWGITPAAAYGTTADSGQAVVYFNIPEPTTGVLSVLSLTALAARRRRKTHESANA